MTMPEADSAIYEGTIRHRRFTVTEREFEHRVGFVYTDLEELPSLASGRLVARGPGLARIRRRDLHGPAGTDLADAVRTTVARQSGRRPDGPIRVLTAPRMLGLRFNPVSFYYCFDSSGMELEAVLAEVTNTPWRERHSYVLGPAGARAGAGPAAGVEAGAGPVLHHEFPKRFHVSPFLGMDYRYSARLTVPGQTLSFHIENRVGDAVHFDATLKLQRSELTARSLSRLVSRYPLGPARTVALIWAHGIGLRLAGVRAFPHPAKGER
jgi:uncharacterized protein